MNETLELLKEIKRTLKLIEKEKGISMNHSMTIIKGWITEDKKEEWENGRMGDIGERLNRLAREQLKLKLLNDIRADIEVCKLENLDYKEYLLELKEIIDSFLNVTKTNSA